MITYVIRDRFGNPVALHDRVDYIDDEGIPRKRVSWRQPSGISGLNGTNTKDMLYGLEMLDVYSDVSTVILCEGEKAADALNSVGFLALGTVTGAGKGKAPTVEILENLRGRKVILWPDNDDVGREHMTEIGLALTGMGVEVNTITWPAAPPKGDAADLVCDGMCPDEIKAAVVVSGFEAGPPLDIQGESEGRPFRLTREETDPPVFVLHWPGNRTLRLSPSGIQTWSAVLTAWLTQQRGTPPWVPSKSESWTSVLASLLEAMTEEDFIEPPPELTNMGRVRVILERMCGEEIPREESDPATSLEQLDRGEPWWDLQNERVCFSFAHLVKMHFAVTSPGDRMKRGEMKLAVEMLGGGVSVRQDVVGGRSGRVRRRLSWVPWSSFLGQA